MQTKISNVEIDYNVVKQTNKHTTFANEVNNVVRKFYTLT